MIATFIWLWIIHRHTNANSDCPRFGSTPLNVCTAVTSSRFGSNTFGMSSKFLCDNDIYTERQYSTSNCEGDYIETNLTFICGSNPNHCNCGHEGDTPCATISDAYSEMCDSNTYYGRSDYVIGVCIGATGSEGGSRLYTCPETEGGAATLQEWDDSYCLCRENELATQPSQCETSHLLHVSCQRHYFEYPLDVCAKDIIEPRKQSIMYTCNHTNGTDSYYQTVYDGYGCSGEISFQSKASGCETTGACECNTDATPETNCQSFPSDTSVNCHGDKIRERVIAGLCVPSGDDDDTWFKHECNGEGFTVIDVYYDAHCTKKEKECPLEYVYDCDYNAHVGNAVATDDVCGYVLTEYSPIPMDLCYTKSPGYALKASCDAVTGEFFMDSYSDDDCAEGTHLKTENLTDSCTRDSQCQCGKGAACKVAAIAPCDDPDHPTQVLVTDECAFGIMSYECDETKGVSVSFRTDNCTKECAETTTVTCIKAEGVYANDIGKCSHYKSIPMDYCNVDEYYGSYRYYCTRDVNGTNDTVYGKITYDDSKDCSESTTEGVVTEELECDESNDECYCADVDHGGMYCNVAKHEYCDASMMGVTRTVNYTVTDMCVMQEPFENFPVQYTCTDGEVETDHTICTGCEYTASYILDPSSKAMCVTVTSTTEEPIAVETTSTPAPDKGKTEHSSSGISTLLVIVIVLSGILLVLAVIAFIYFNNIHQWVKCCAKEEDTDIYVTLLDNKRDIDL